MEIIWKKLQNGSDIRGVAIEGIQGEQVNLGADVVETIGKSFVKWLKKSVEQKITVAVGMDSRVTGSNLKEAFSRGMIMQGADVIDCGLASTPAMFMATLSNKISANAGVMLTASHLPFNRNGLKFFTEKGGLEKKDISEILEIASINQFEVSDKIGLITEYDFISEYSEILVQKIREKVNHPNYNKPLEGLKIIVDAGNGSGGFFAHKVLVPLGANIEGSQFLEPDGNFPNHIPNPEDSVAMQSVCQAVKRSNADFGIIFDTDVDRSAVVDQNGNPINRNTLIALISAIILEEHPKTTIVTDSITSEGLSWFINEKLNGLHHRFKRGYKNVINESIRLNNDGKPSWLAIETSGHAALKENYFLDDGAYLVAKLLIKLAQMKLKNKNLIDLILELPTPIESKEYRISIKNPEFLNYGQNVIDTIAKKLNTIPDWMAEPNNYEGIRVKCNGTNEQGWFLVRMSLHDPLIPINIETNIDGGVDVIKTKLKSILVEFKELDLTQFV